MTLTETMETNMDILQMLHGAKNPLCRNIIDRSELLARIGTLESHVVSLQNII